MKKLLIILAFLPLIGLGQIDVTTLNGGLWTFQGKVVVFDTSTADTITLFSIGDGIEIGDGIKIGDGAYLFDIVYPEQYMKEEETLNELIS
jgi:hypothetical protein